MPLKEKWIDMAIPSGDVLDDIAVTDPTDTTFRTVTLALPTGAEIVRVDLMCLVHIMNNSANAQKLDIALLIKKSTEGAYGGAVWTESDCVGLPAIDGVSASMTLVGADVSNIVDAAVDYDCKCTVTLSSANNVRITTQYVLIVTYKLTG